MFICIAGNVEPQKVFDICDEMLKDKPPVKIIRKPVDEPLDVVCRYTEHNLPVAAPLFAIGYKEAADGEKTPPAHQLRRQGEEKAQQLCRPQCGRPGGSRAPRHRPV